MKSISIRRSWVAAFVLSTLSASSVYALEVDVAEAPTDNLALTVSAIQSAKQTLLLNIYELTSQEIADALIGRIQAGVQVQIIEEGQPVGGLSTAAKGIETGIVQAMQAQSGDRFLEMTSKAGGKRRFAYDHAKYAVIDGTTLLIGSENYSPTGNPVPGSVGNRGWEVLVHDAAIAQSYAAVFQSDSDMSAGDLLDLTKSGAIQILAKKPPKPTPAPAPSSGAVPAVGGTHLEADSVEAITSPNTSEAGLVNMINNAKSTIEIEQMELAADWKLKGTQSPLVSALIQAAQRGVKVRALINDDKVFAHGKPFVSKNAAAVQVLNQGGVSAKIADIKAMGVDYIHNKGALIDGNETLISSINWNENSVTRNREAAVLIHSTQVFDHYEALFNADWAAGGTVGQMVSLETPAVAPCPAKLHVVAEIGTITVSDSEDSDFKDLSGKVIEATLSRQSTRDSCILSATRGRLYVQLKTSSSGDLVFSMEGYTSPHSKLYSIRTHDASALPGLNGTLAATVYDASGPGREVLGQAQIELSADGL